MSAHTNSDPTAEAAQKANLAGGAATAGGMNFQAAVTALLCVSILRGEAVPWLSGFIDDVPVRVRAETGGPGDDVAVEFASNEVVEIQAKQGLKAGKRLWEPIRAICRAMKSGEQQRAAIVVSPTSSEPVKHKLPRDIKRIANGRTDGLSEIGTKLIALLNEEKVDPKRFCEGFRVIVVHAIDGERADIDSAEIALEYVTGDAGRARAAWSCIYGDASLIIEQRSARSVRGIVKALEKFDLLPVDFGDGTVAKNLFKINRVTRSKAEKFALPAWNASPIGVEAGWMQLTIVRPEDSEPVTTKEDALKVYQNWDEKAGAGWGSGLEPLSVGQFYRHCVVVGGPGMGKSTYLKRLALHYTDEGFPTLRINLRVLAVRIKKQGTGFTEALFDLGIDGSGLSNSESVGSAFDDWILLCDGLDECGAQQEEISAELAALATRNPRYRIIVTTRPIGYDTALLRDWRHYHIVPFSEDYAGRLVVDLIRAMPGIADDISSRASHVFLGRSYLNPLPKVIGRSPLILSLMAVVFVDTGAIPSTPSDLYRRALILFETNTLKREVVDLPSMATLQSCLSLLAYYWISDPTSSEEQMFYLVITRLSERLGASEIAAAGAFEKALEYWEATGLIERLHYRGERLVSFIHKGFAEFIAAKEILQLSKESGDAIDLVRYSDEIWLEALRHVSSLADRNVIADGLAASAEHQNRLVGLALEAEAQLDPKLDAGLLSKLLDETFQIIGGPNQIASQNMTKKLLLVASKYRGEVVERACALKSVDRPWARLSAWALLTAEGDNSGYSQSELEAAFILLLSELKPVGSFSKFGGLRLGGSERSLAQSFAQSAIELLLSHSDEAFCDKWIPKVVALDFMDSGELLSWREELANKTGKTYLKYNYPEGRDTSGRLIQEMGRFTPDQRNFNEILFGALSKVAANDGTTTTEPLVVVGAFCEAIGYWDRPGYDAQRWRDFTGFDNLETVLSSVLGVLGLDKNRLGQEANTILKAMAEIEDTDFFQVSFMIPHVDAPEPDWDRLHAPKEKFGSLEAAVHHPSEWYAILAARILDSGVTLDERHGLVQRILRDGRFNALWFGSALGESLGKKVVTALIIERIHGDSVPGCHNLFRALKGYVTEVDSAVVEALRSGLIDRYVRTAQEAAKLADQLLDQASEQLLPLIEQAYEYWVDHEPDKDPSSGVVPPSPRETLLKSRLRFWTPSEDELFELCADKRGDVSSIGDGLFCSRLETDKAFRDEVLHNVTSHKLGIRFLRDLLADTVPLTREQRMDICKLTRSADDNSRYIAMDALVHPDIEADFARAELRRLETDEVQEIREKANRLLFSEKL